MPDASSTSIGVLKNLPKAPATLLHMKNQSKLRWRDEPGDEYSLHTHLPRQFSAMERDFNVPLRTGRESSRWLTTSQDRSQASNFKQARREHISDVPAKYGIKYL